MPNIFSTTDRIYHSKLRRSVANAFALSTLVNYEPYVTDTVSTFLTQLDSRYAGKPGPDGICDMSDWTRFFALDVVSALTQGKSYGFLDAGYDHIGVLHARTTFLRYFSVVRNFSRCIPSDYSIFPPIIGSCTRHRQFFLSDGS